MSGSGARPTCSSTQASGCSSALIAFGAIFAAIVVAACIYVSSSAIAVKALIDFRALADDETDLVLAILLFEDIAIAAVLGFVATGGGARRDPTAGVTIKAFVFVAASLAASRLARGAGSAPARSPRVEFFLLAVFGFVIAMSAVAQELELVRGDRRPDGRRDPVGERRPEDIEQRFFASATSSRRSSSSSSR